jgi:hypothetical protein
MSYYKVDLSEIWDSAIKVAGERDSKGDYRVFSPDQQLVGILGEYTFSLITGIPLDIRLLVGGDDGFDFPGVNVKASEEKKAFNLIEYTDKVFSGWYIFVCINMEEKYGYVKGVIHSTTFQEKCRIKDFGFGPRKALSLSELDDFAPKSPVKLAVPEGILV